MKSWWSDVCLAVGFTLGVGSVIGAIAIGIDYYMKGGL